MVWIYRFERLLAIVKYGDTVTLCAITTTLAAATGCKSALFIDPLSDL